MNIIVLILILVLLFGGGLGWHQGYVTNGYYGGGFGLVLIVFPVLALVGRI